MATVVSLCSSPVLFNSCLPKTNVTTSSERTTRSYSASLTKRLSTCALRSSIHARSFFAGDNGALWTVREPMRTSKFFQSGGVRAASKSDVPEYTAHPPMMEKPKLPWRILAVIPYIIPSLEALPVVKQLESNYILFVVYKELAPIGLSWVAKLPGWFMLAYFFGAYLGIVRNNRWPHFLRFHIVMGMLMEITLQIVAATYDFFPRKLMDAGLLGVIKSILCMWYIPTVLGCMVCALMGGYADVPFVSESAYMQIPQE